MFHLTLIQADLTLVATLNETTSKWDCVVTDMYNGPTIRPELSLEELIAILALGLGGVAQNHTPGYDIVKLYEVAESATKGWPMECRPIP